MIIDLRSVVIKESFIVKDIDIFLILTFSIKHDYHVCITVNSNNKSYLYKSVIKTRAILLQNFRFKFLLFKKDIFYILQLLPPLFVQIIILMHNKYLCLNKYLHWIYLELK